MMLTVYIGFDKREPIAYEVLKYSIEKHASKPVNVQPLKIDKLEAQGLITRPVKREGGQMFDVISEAPQSTEFACSRFLAPLIQQTGWAVFMDCDMVFIGDIYDLFEELEPQYAVQCVKHEHQPTEEIKMDGQVQTRYTRKNWSSFFAFNADHPANERLTYKRVNTNPGRDLHHFNWLKDSEIGSLQTGWNWLVNVQPKPEPLYNAHYTLGGAWFPNWDNQPNDDLWLTYHDEYLNK
jgi:lipopolysaccharide biosynthesis glycosyltransferase